MPAKIEIRDVTKSYAAQNGALDAVGGVTFDIADSEFVAMIGPSGCGKTTLLNIIAGFDHPDRGHVRIDGALRNGPDPKGIVISQQGSVFPWMTVQQNLMFGLRNPQVDKCALADHYAAVVGLTGFEKSYPHELSGGMLKRVEMARALVVKPDILYMDEPLAALDALTSLQVRFELLRILAEERHTCLLITHNVEEAIHMADRILVLSSRPATIKATFPVSLPRPRNLSSREAVELKAAILAEFGL